MMTQIDKNIAINLKRIRKARNMSLDMLAERTGVSKSMLGQIERGESNPTVTTIGKIVEGLKVPFEQLIYEKKETVVVPSLAQAPIYKEKAGEYSIRILLPYEAERSFEIYQGKLEPGACLEETPHGEHTWEYMTVLEGEIELSIDGQRFHVPEKSSLYFAGDRPHSCHNVGDTAACISFMITRRNAC